MEPVHLQDTPAFRPRVLGVSCLPRSPLLPSLVDLISQLLGHISRTSGTHLEVRATLQGTAVGAPGSSCAPPCPLEPRDSAVVCILLAAQVSRPAVGEQELVHGKPWLLAGQSFGLLAPVRGRIEPFVPFSH